MCECRSRAKPRLFIALNSFFIVILLLFLLLQGLVLQPIASVSFLHFIIPEHTRHYISSQTNINVSQIYTTFFATCYQSIGSSKLDCSHRSLYFDWIQFFGVPDIFNSQNQNAPSKLTPNELEDMLSCFKSAILYDKVLNISSVVLLIIIILTRFIIFKICALSYKREKCGTEKLTTYFVRMLFITCHTLSVPSAFLLALFTSARPFFHIYSTFYGTQSHIVTEESFNRGLILILWMVVVFSFIDGSAARYFFLQMSERNKEISKLREASFELSTDISNTSLFMSPDINYSSPNNSARNSHIFPPFTHNLAESNRASFNSMRSSDLESFRAKFTPFHNRFFNNATNNTSSNNLELKSLNESHNAHNNPSSSSSSNSSSSHSYYTDFKDPELFKPGTRQHIESDSELSDDDIASIASDSLTIRSTTTINDNFNHNSIIHRTNSLDSNASSDISSITGSTLVGSIRYPDSENSSVLSAPPSLISDSSDNFSIGTPSEASTSGQFSNIENNIESLNFDSLNNNNENTIASDSDSDDDDDDEYATQQRVPRLYNSAGCR